MESSAWAKVKRDQAFQADYIASVASGIGEYAIANACYRLSAILARQAREIEEEGDGAPRR